jgi:Domain of unknown function (DUF4397)
MNYRIVFLSLLTMVGACRKSTPDEPVEASPNARVMFLQPNPYFPAMDLYSAYVDTFKVNTSPVSWPGALTYMTAPSGVRLFTCNKTGTTVSYLQVNYYFHPDSSYTIVNQTGIIKDDLSAPADGYAKVRLIQGAIYVHNMNWMVHGGDTLAKGIGYGNVIDFRPIKAGDYVFDLHDFDAPYSFDASLQVTLEAGRIYTILALMEPTADSVALKIGMKLFTNK